jgi:lactose/L-arabinose transport system permease protein
LLDSARIDGCTEQRLFFQMVLPLLKPAFGAAGIYIFMMTWNDYLFPLIMMSDDTMMLFPVGLASLKSLYVVEYGMIMAGSVLSTLPVIIMFVLLQRQFVSGLVQGAVKQ